jgi:pimeloyl-ACP methyl ester carboxylesterase
VILIDNAGGKVPEQYAGWAAHMINVTLALGFTEVDVFGFSMGGFVAQLIVLDGPKRGLKVRQLIVAGSGPSQGEGTSTGSSEYFTQLYGTSTKKEGFLRTFFGWSEKKQRLVSSGGSE